MDLVRFFLAVDECTSITGWLNYIKEGPVVFAPLFADLEDVCVDTNG